MSSLLNKIRSNKFTGNHDENDHCWNHSKIYNKLVDIRVRKKENQNQINWLYEISFDCEKYENGDPKCLLRHSIEHNVAEVRRTC